jgi:enoyl-CoA hydratase/carnithine racemase
VRLSRDKAIARITIDNPDARNALTLDMYDDIAKACRAIAADPEYKVVLVQGEGDNFAAGTHIQEFATFGSGRDGIAYEERIEGVLAALEGMPIPTVALVDGYAAGGGLMIVAACDLCIASSRARFGAPMARSLGNTLSRRNLRRLERVLGLGRTRRITMLSEFIEAAEALACGLACDVCAPEELELVGHAKAACLLAAAPTTIAATRTLLRQAATDPAGDDAELISEVYASGDFIEGVRAFLEKRKPIWGLSQAGRDG